MESYNQYYEGKYHYHYGNGPADFKPGYAYYYDADGKLLSTHELPCLLDPRLLYPAAALETVGAIFGGPPAGWAYLHLGHVVDQYEDSPSNLSVLLHYRPLRWLAWIFSPSVLVAAFTFWLLSRRKAPWSHCLLWTAFVLIFGLPGLVGVLAVETRSALVRCAACKKRRPIDRKLCPHCKAPFAAPPRNGTEIFIEAVQSGAGAFIGV